MNKLKLWLVFHKRALIGSFSYLKQEPFASGMAVFIIAIILVLSSLIWMITDAMHSAVLNWQSNKQISLYLDVPSDENTEAKLLAKVLATNGVARANLKTASDGLLLLQSESGMQDILSYLPENPLPSIIEVTPSLEINTKAALENLFIQLKGYSGVSEAKLDLDWFNKIVVFFGFVFNLLNVLLVLLAVALVLIITNTLRLIINDRRDEITVMKFVGADEPYIMRPFLYSGVWYGLFAAFLAIIMLNLLFLSLQTGINKLLVTYQVNYVFASLSIYKLLLLSLFAMGLGWIGARLSLKAKYSVY